MEVKMLVALSLAVLIIWATATVIYRILFHPLAGFPGPKLAIATYTYGYYYDLYLPGQYTFNLKELHERYGPVIRLNPDELHFNDPDYHDEIFNISNGKADKAARVAGTFGARPNVIGTAEHDLHRVRRIVPIIDGLCDRLAEASKTGEAIDLKYGYAAVTVDIMNEYCFSTNPHTVVKPDFGRKNFDDLHAFFEISLIATYIPLVMTLLDSLPDWLMRITNPAVRDMLDQQKQLATQIEDIRQGRDLAHLQSGHRTVFHDLLKSKLPPQEMARDRLRDEAFSLIAAGSETTASVLKNLSYHISANYGVHQKLLQELKTVMPHPTDSADLKRLEGLPYLNAVIREGLRISHPVSHRLSRKFPEKTLVYDNKPIPRDTVLHMSALLLHENEDIFPDAKIFRPERWLENDGLQRYLVPFSRGTRSCLGINLAWAELYLIIAKIFRRFEFYVDRLVRERDIDVTRDVVIGFPCSDSKGVIVQVKELHE